jgi:hypothetical protein
MVDCSGIIKSNRKVGGQRSRGVKFKDSLMEFKASLMKLKNSLMEFKASFPIPILNFKF